jgi:hypothetical protein
MTLPEFSKEMDRLVDCFGAKNYPLSRLELIQGEVRGVGAQTWKRVVDKLIGECAFAPLLPQIREALAVERERAHNYERIERQREAETAWQSGEEIRENMKRIRQIMAQAVSEIEETVGGGK